MCGVRSNGLCICLNRAAKRGPTAAEADEEVEEDGVREAQHGEVEHLDGLEEDEGRVRKVMYISPKRWGCAWIRRTFCRLAVLGSGGGCGRFTRRKM